MKDAPATGLVPIRVDDKSSKLEVGQKTIAIGNPFGLDQTLTTGIVSALGRSVPGDHGVTIRDMVQTDAAINPGNSGGPILNEDKNVIAVTTCKLTSADMVGFGIPSLDVRSFVDGFRTQKAAFGVVCPACDELLEVKDRYCGSCGTDLEPHGIETYFEPPEAHPVVKFVEGALAEAKIDPVLARHGSQNWSFHSGSAPIKIWCCCSEHLCFSSPLAQAGKKNLGDLFRFLLSAEHEPFSFDLAENVVRLNLTFHISDVFARGGHDEAASWIAKFVKTADDFDNLLIEKFGCEPAPETQLTFLKQSATR